MKTCVIFLVLSFFFLSCNTKNKTEKSEEGIPVDLEVVRFDKIFFETEPQDLAKVKKEFPFFNAPTFSTVVFAFLGLANH